MNRGDKELIKKIGAGMTTVNDAERAEAIILQRDFLLEKLLRLECQSDEERN